MKEVYTLAEVMEMQARDKKASKYRNIKTEYGGRMYDSAKEATFAATLDALKKSKDPFTRVVSWEAQVPYPCVVKGKKICKYIADFQVTYADGHVEVIDVKSTYTKKLPVYGIKKKLVEALYEIEIKEEI